VGLQLEPTNLTPPGRSDRQLGFRIPHGTAPTWIGATQSPRLHAQAIKGNGRGTQAADCTG
jgi:hypothetical protein